MKIAQVAPLWESVPPVLYGGTERVVSFITEELVRQGHDVTLFASGDSTTKAGWCRCALRRSACRKSSPTMMRLFIAMLRTSVQLSEGFRYHTCAFGVLALPFGPTQLPRPY